MAKSAEEIRAELQKVRDEGATKDLGGVAGAQLRVADPANDGTTPSAQNSVAEPPGSHGKVRMFSRSHEPGATRTLPHSVEAEVGVLSCMFQNPQKCIPIATQRIGAEQLHVPRHQLMFNALVNFLEDHGHFDLPTFTVEMMQTGQDKAMGGPGWITEVHQFAAASEAIAYYLDIVCEKYAARKVIEFGAECVREAYEAQADLPMLIEEVRERAQRLATLSLPRKDGLTVRSPNELMGMTFDDSDNYFGDRTLAAGQPCTLIGPGGVGKTRLSLQLAVSMITGRDFVGMPTRASRMKWLFIQTENSNRRLQHDLKNIISALELTPEEVAILDKHLHIHTIEKDGDCFLNLLNPTNYAAVNRLVQDVQADFVGWDPLNSLTDSDLNSDMDMRAVVSAISALTRAGNPNGVPLVLHHSLTGKIGASRAVGWDKSSFGRNSKVLHSWTRTQINLAPRSGDNPNLLIMSCGKNNNGRLFPELGLRFDDQLGIYRRDDSFDPEQFREEVGIGASKRKTVTVEDVVALCEDGIPKPKLVSRIKDEFGIQQRAAYDAVNRAEAAGRIKKDPSKSWPSTYSAVRLGGADYDN